MHQAAKSGRAITMPDGKTVVFRTEILKSAGINWMSHSSNWRVSGEVNAPKFIITIKAMHFKDFDKASDYLKKQIVEAALLTEHEVLQNKESEDSTK